MELQSYPRHMALVYSALSINIVAGRGGEVSGSEDGVALQGKIVEEICQKRVKY